MTPDPLLADDEAVILLVDDRPQNLLALEAVLEPLGHRLIRATSGDEALRQLLSEDVAVILLDVQMPGMNGFETAGHIKQRERSQDIPILFLTAQDRDMSAIMQGFDSGAVDYMTKPVDETLLRAKVQVFVDLALKTRLLRRQSELLATRLDQQYQTEARHLRKLADAAVVINSTLSLSEMLRVINDSAREVIGAHQAETVITGLAIPAADVAQSRSYSPKYETWAREGREVDLTPVYKMAAGEDRPVRMTKRQITTTLSARGLFGIAPGHPLLEGWLAVPVIGRTGRRLGFIQVADKVEGDFTAADEVVALQLAQLAAVAIENAERFEQEHRIAEILQRSLLPEALPKIAGLQLSAHYQPGGGGTQVGGDWYDVFGVGDGRVALVIGDVAGHGVRAAAVMGQLRTALRAYALRGAPPAEVVADLDRFLQEVNDGDLATVVLLLLDVAQHTVEYVNAGHLPPLLVTGPGQSRFLDADPHQPLGVLPDPKYRATRTTMPDSGLLVLYTDGLVEERADSIDEGLRRLTEAADLSITDIDRLCQQIVDVVAPSGKDDDVTVLAVRLEGGGR